MIISIDDKWKKDIDEAREVHKLSRDRFIELCVLMQVRPEQVTNMAIYGISPAGGK